LLAPDDAEQTVALALRAVAKLRPGAAALLVRDLPLDGPVAQLLRAVAGDAQRTYDGYERACLAPDCGPARPKAEKEMRRLIRRAEERGRARFSIVDRPQDIRDATEQFLALEARGWKGRAGTALVQASGRALFARSMAASMAQSDAVAIAMLTIGPDLAAAGVVLRAGQHAFYWKTAFDENLAVLSPGRVLSHHLGAWLLANGGTTLVDSCAISNHPMIDRIWTGRRTIGDLLVPLPGVSSKAFAAAARWEERQRNALHWVKRILRGRGGRPAPMPSPGARGE